MFKNTKKAKKISVQPAGKLHVRVEYSLDAQFVSELLDTGFESYNRFMALASGQADPGPRGVTDGEKSRTQDKS